VAAVLKSLSPMTVGVLDLVLPELAQAIERSGAPDETSEEEA
jgi:hypothetical protein